MYKTIIIKSGIDRCIEKLKTLAPRLASDGSIFCIVHTQYRDSVVAKDFMDVISEGLKLKLQYINTITIPMKTNHLDNILYCVWLVKDLKTYYFDKDPIREKSIWKDVEWGKRTKNYNPKGKDPGNVWIPTEDDGNANITKHKLLSDEEVFARLLSSTIVGNDQSLIINDLEESYGDIDFGEYRQAARSNRFTTGKVVFGTAELMNKITDRSTDLIITSPPYWDLKDYYKKNQIGQEAYTTYCQRMYAVWRQCYEKLKDDGSIWININIRVKAGRPILLPKLFVDQLKQIGFYYRGIFVWHKSSGIPTSARNLSDHHEYVLTFTKGLTSKIDLSTVKTYQDYKNDDISRKLFWNINRKAGSVGKNTIHPAIFPTELVNRIIDISTVKGDLVLDPFLGSGTSLIAALNHGRNFVGYEFNEGFMDLMKDRYKKELVDYSDDKIEYLC